MVRRTLAIGAGLIVLILLVIGFRGCLSARKEQRDQGLRAATRASWSSSRTWRGRQLFDLLGSEGGQDQAVDVANAVNALRSESATLVDRAQRPRRPDEVSSAQDYLVEALELRRDGLAVVGPRAARGARRPGAPPVERPHRRGDAGLPGQRCAAAGALPPEPRGGDARTRTSTARSPCRGPASSGSCPTPNGSSPPSSPTRSPRCAAARARPATRRRRRACTATASAPSRSGGVALTPGGSATVPLADDLVVRRPGGQPGREQRDRRERAGHGGRGRRRRSSPRRRSPRSRVGEAQNVTIPVGEAAAHRPERAR